MTWACRGLRLGHLSATRRARKLALSMRLGRPVAINRITMQAAGNNIRTWPRPVSGWRSVGSSSALSSSPAGRDNNGPFAHLVLNGLAVERFRRVAHHTRLLLVAQAVPVLDVALHVRVRRSFAVLVDNVTGAD